MALRLLANRRYGFYGSSALTPRGPIPRTFIMLYRPSATAAAARPGLALALRR